MQTLLEKINRHKFLLSSLLSTGFIMFLANLFADETRTLVTDLLFIPVPGALIIFQNLHSLLQNINDQIFGIKHIIDEKITDF